MVASLAFIVYSCVLTQVPYPCHRSNSINPVKLRRKTRREERSMYHNNIEVFLKSHIEGYDFIVTLVPICAYNLEKGGTSI